jgi:hypothetical protein
VKFFANSILSIIVFSAAQSYAAGPECSLLFKFQPENDAVIAKIHDQNEFCHTVSCMAHTATTKIENMIFLKTGRRIALSVSFLIANAARLRFESKYDIENGEKATLPIYNKIQTVEQDFIYEAALKYGIVPEKDWQPPKLFGALNDRNLNLKFILQAPFESITDKKIFSNIEMQKSFDRRLTELTGEMPKEFEFEGKRYTPKQFAQAMLPEFKHRQILIEGHENLNKEYRDFTDTTVTIGVDESLAEAIKMIDKGEAVPASFTWTSQYRDQGIFKVEGKAQKTFSKEFYHGMVIVNYALDDSGQVEWLKLANSHGIIDSGLRKNFDGYYYVHRSYFEPYLLRLYLFDQT